MTSTVMMHGTEAYSDHLLVQGAHRVEFEEWMVQRLIPWPWLRCTWLLGCLPTI